MSIVPTGHPDPDRKRAIQLYGAFGASLLLMLLPSMIAACISLVILLITMVMAYSMRKKSPAGSLSENHATYLIRTIWIGGLIGVITLALGSMYLLQNVDNTPLEPCTQNLAAQIETLGPNVSATALQPYLQPCMDAFVKLNLRTLIISAALSIVPIMLYFAFRFARGLSRVTGGYRIAKPKSWF